MTHNHSFEELKALFHKGMQAFEDRADQELILLINLQDVKSEVATDVFWWSYYNHKFAASKGQDSEAMDEWHKLEDKIEAARLLRFRNRREANTALYAYVIKNHHLFSKVLFAAIQPSIKAEFGFGYDLAEEKYILKQIRENHATEVCEMVGHLQADPVMHLVRDFYENAQQKYSVHILSNSQQLNTELVNNTKEMIRQFGLYEADLENADMVLLINDLDALSVIPLIDSEAPILTVDVSPPNSPNFPYILLKDDGFDQVYSFSKKHPQEAAEFTVLRSLAAGLVSVMRGSRFNEQIAINYMDDYFAPLAHSVGKHLKDFMQPISMLASKLDT